MEDLYYCIVWVNDTRKYLSNKYISTDGHLRELILEDFVNSVVDAKHITKGEKITLTKRLKASPLIEAYIYVGTGQLKKYEHYFK